MDMNILSHLADGFAIALSPWTLMLAFVGCFVGTIIGALPGLGPSNGVALLIPISFSMGFDAISALVLLTSVYYGAMYGGRISSILLNIPGDEPAMMTTLDGYPMAKNGQAGEALVVSGVASFVGSFIATIGLALLAPLLARGRVQLRAGGVFRALRACLLHAGRHGVEQSGEIGDGRLHRPRPRDDRAGQDHGDAALHLRRSAPDGRDRLPRRHRRTVCGVRGVQLHRDAWQGQRHRRGAGQALDPVGDAERHEMDHAARHRGRLCRGHPAGGRGLARLVSGLHGGEGHRQGQGQLRHRQPQGRRGTRGRQQRGRGRRADPDADARGAGIGDHGGAAGASAHAQHHGRGPCYSPSGPMSSGR